MVKRWTCGCKDDFGYYMYAVPKEDEYGACVGYTDYAALEAELEAVAYYAEPHWKGAGLPLESGWIIREISRRANTLDDEAEQLRAELAEAKERERVLREWIQDHVVEDGCAYGDNCTDEAMRRFRHGRCIACSGRAALGEEG